MRATTTATAATASCHRHDISDRAWELLAPHLPGGPGQVGRPAQDNRRFINAVFWELRTGATGRDLPPDYGDGCAAHRRFSRWCRKDVWAALQAALINEPDYEWLMIDANQNKVHQHGTGAAGGNQAVGRTKGG